TAPKNTRSPPARRRSSPVRPRPHEATPIPETKNAIAAPPNRAHELVAAGPNAIARNFRDAPSHATTPDGGGAHARRWDPTKYRQVNPKTSIDDRKSTWPIQRGAFRPSLIQQCRRPRYPSQTPRLGA